VKLDRQRVMQAKSLTGENTQWEIDSKHSGMFEQGNGGGCTTIFEFLDAAHENRQAVGVRDWPVFFIIDGFLQLALAMSGSVTTLFESEVHGRHST
jgi:hypothetical protein